MGRRIDLADHLSHADAETQRGMHGHRDADESCARRSLGIERLYGDVQDRGGIPGLFQISNRLGHAHRLVA
jgi:hypothetical protein